jgi:hypothetical protein
MTRRDHSTHAGKEVMGQLAEAIHFPIGGARLSAALRQSQQDADEPCDTMIAAGLAVQNAGLAQGHDQTLDGFFDALLVLGNDVTPDRSAAGPEEAFAGLLSALACSSQAADSSTDGLPAARPCSKAFQDVAAGLVGEKDLVVRRSAKERVPADASGICARADYRSDRTSRP